MPLASLVVEVEFIMTVELEGPAAFVPAVVALAAVVLSQGHIFGEGATLLFAAFEGGRFFGFADAFFSEDFR